MSELTERLSLYSKDCIKGQKVESGTYTIFHEGNYNGDDYIQFKNKNYTKVYLLRQEESGHSLEDVWEERRRTGHYD